MCMYARSEVPEVFAFVADSRYIGDIRLGENTRNAYVRIEEHSHGLDAFYPEAYTHPPSTPESSHVPRHCCAECAA